MVGERGAAPAEFEWLGREAAALLDGVALPAGDIALSLFSGFPHEELVAVCPRARRADGPETVWCDTPEGCAGVTTHEWHRGNADDRAATSNGTVICVSVAGGQRLIGVIKAPNTDELASDPAAVRCLCLAARALGRLWEARGQARAGGVRPSATPGEEDRQWLSMELHDGLAQTLTAALHHLQMYQDAKYAYHPQRAEMLPRAEALLRKGMAETRDLISTLRQATSQRMRLGALLREEAHRLELELGCPVEFREETANESLPSEVEIALYRVAREALANVRKHAAAKRVRVSLLVEESGVRLVVRDWGLGFDLSGTPPTGSNGLANMRRRVEALGGSWGMQSIIGEGTTVMATVPLQIRGPHAE
ncbi:MAG: sensor histidine kinase [Chloroflexota bacterium]|nr:sensor histidine kinase [Chloroflexota bacterium]